MLVFKTLHVEGFGSIQEPVKFVFTGGLHIVKGDNGNGKTTLFSALFWVLYQLNLKGISNTKVPTWKRIRTKEFRGTRVVLDIYDDAADVNYRIARHIDFTGTTSGYKGHSSLMVFKDGNIVEEELHKNDIQSYINRLMGMNAKIFSNSVLFGQRMVRLIQSKDADKRELFEELFELAFIPAAKEKAKSNSDALNIKILKIDGDIAINVREIENLETSITEKEEALADWEEQHATRIKNINERIKNAEAGIIKEEAELVRLKKLKKSEKPVTFQAELDAAKKANEAYDIVNAAYKKLANDLSKYQDEYSKSMRKVKDLEADILSIKTNCPTCKQPLPANKVEAAKAELEKQLKVEKKVALSMNDSAKDTEIDMRSKHKELQVKQTELEEASAKFQKLKNASTSTNTVDTDLAVAQERLDNHNDNLDTAKLDLKSEEKVEKPKYKLDDLRKKVTKYKGDNTALKTKKEGLEDDKEHYDWWNTKGFNSGGLKAFVFNNMLGRLNEAIAKYAARLGQLVQFSVDLSKASKPFKTEIFKDGAEVSYEELSGGQQQRIDICLAFAMFDIIGINKATNLLILDEVLEGLDAKGIEQVFDLLREKASPDMAVYLITHLTNVDTHASDEIIMRNDGVSSYIEN